MINSNAVDFSKRRSEEDSDKFLLTLSIDGYIAIIL